ncbi:MAG: TIGR03435 family protein [Planctomycetota bacterium]|nr:TIGR03435 family protein [Planctomycetota bacterium]
MSNLVPEKFHLAAKAVRDVAVPAGPPPEVLAAAVAAGKPFEANIHAMIVQRRRTLVKSITRIAAALIVASGLVIGSYVFLMHGSTVAFAQVRDLIEQMQTMTCRIHLSQPAAEGRPMDMDIRASYILPHLMRQEIAIAGLPGAMVITYDFQAGKAITLNPAGKTATMLNLGQLPPELLKKTQNFAEEMKKLVQKDGAPIGREAIDGTDAVGFRVDNEGVATDIWVDAAKGETLLLVEMDMPGQGHVRITDIAINPSLDASLFSLAVPAGYRETAALDIPLENLTEDDLVAGLRFLAENNDNVFPVAPNMTPKIMRNLGKTYQPAPGLSDDEIAKNIAAGQAEIGTRIGRLRVFLQLNISTFRYAGDGVNLGDAAAPVCWYKPKGAALYRVVHGDLSVADVAEADLPKIETPPPGRKVPQNGPTVKISPSEKTTSSWNTDTDGWDIEGASALSLAAMMYGSSEHQTVADGDLPQGHFNVQLRASKKGESFEELQAAAQQALAQQLGLAASRAPRKMSVYLLKAPNGKPDALRPTSGGWKSCSGGSGGQARTVHNMAISEALTPCLEMRLGRPVLDETGIKGAFDYTLALPADSSFEAIAKAVRDGLGMELVPAERERDVLVVKWNGQALTPPPHP